MNKQEVIKELQKQAIHHCGEIECYKDGCEKSVELSKAINIISQIKEPQKVVVPKFVGEWIKDEDFEKAEQVNSNSQLYKQAGNAIVVDVLEAIFSQLFLKNGTDDNI